MASKESFFSLLMVVHRRCYVSGPQKILEACCMHGLSGQAERVECSALQPLLSIFRDDQVSNLHGNTTAAPLQRRPAPRSITFGSASAM